MRVCVSVLRLLFDHHADSPHRHEPVFRLNTGEAENFLAGLWLFTVICVIARHTVATSVYMLFLLSPSV